MGQGEFEAFVMSGATPAAEFRPFVAYNPDGHFLEYFASNESCVSEYINATLTIHRGRETGRIVGVFISLPGIGTSSTAPDSRPMEIANQHWLIV